MPLVNDRDLCYASCVSCTSLKIESIQECKVPLKIIMSSRVEKAQALMAKYVKFRLQNTGFANVGALLNLSEVLLNRNSVTTFSKFCLKNKVAKCTKFCSSLIEISQKVAIIFSSINIC